MRAIDIKIVGISDTTQNIILTEIKISNRLIDATYEVMDKIIENANRIAYQGARKWSHGDEQKSIEESWEKRTVRYTHGFGCEGILENISQHAAAVEFGVHHRIYPKREGGVLYLGDDFEPPFRRSVRGQQGKFYLTQASNMIGDYLPIWKRYIRSAII